MATLKQTLWKLLDAALGERQYLRLKYWRITGDVLNLRHPRTYNEKLQWLKLNDKNPMYCRLVDKIAVKDYAPVKECGCKVARLLGVWDNPDEIDYDSLPDRFVLKCNHNSGGVIICRDKSVFDRQKAAADLKRQLDEDYYATTREWPYKNIRRQVFAEEFIDSGDRNLTDYKFFCFNGEPKVMYMSKDSAEDPRTDFFDMEFNHLPITVKDPPSDILPQKPSQFEEMRRMAGLLSKGIPHVRIDLYVAGGEIYFGEFTFYHCSGFIKVKPEEWNLKLGSWITTC